MKGLIEAENKTLTEDIQIVDTDDPIDLFLCGTEVAGSCQRIDGDPDLNKGLLGYLIDGKNRLLAIKDQEGRILARCLIRILWDRGKAVLFRERLYPDDINDVYEKALNAVAAEKAQELGIPLASLDGKGRFYNNLQALGGPVPYEYVDGAGGIQVDGKFTIPHARLLN